MRPIVPILQWICLVPTIGGSVYAVSCLLAVLRFRRQPIGPPQHTFSFWPPVTVLKPVCGLEKNLKVNLRSTCLLDYPQFQVVFSVEEPRDPAIPLLKEIQQAFGPAKVSVAIGNRHAGTNGKINNLLGGLPYARHDILVISDSDVRLRPDYLKAIVAPLADPEVGCVCTLYKATCAETWFEKLELLTLNADYIPNLVFAHITGAAKFCLGASVALRCSTLNKIGGLEELADYLAEDNRLGQRILMSGKRIAIVPYFVDTVVDLNSPSQWWNHQVYLDQNIRAEQPMGFFFTVLIRSIPFALAFMATRLGDAVGLTVLGGAIALRLATAAVILRWGFRDHEGLRSLALLPVRDVAGLISWFLAFTKKTTIWRGKTFILTRDGRLAPRG